MSKLLFLPDRNGREKESEGAGLVRLSADTSEMAALAKRMVIRQETDEITPDAAYQGAMALALLLDSWQGTDVRLAVRTIDAQKSRFASWVMAARPMEQRNQPIPQNRAFRQKENGNIEQRGAISIITDIGNNAAPILPGYISGRGQHADFIVRHVGHVHLNGNHSMHQKDNPIQQQPQ